MHQLFLAFFFWPDSIPPGVEYVILALFPLCGPLQWIILAIFFGWRISVCRKHKGNIGKHIGVTLLLCPCVIFLTNMAQMLYSYR
jgi:hypothetical protein